MKATNLVGIPSVMDDLGIMWFFVKGENEEHRICVLLEDGTFDKGGYWVTSLEDGIDYLIMGDYITKHDGMK